MKHLFLAVFLAVGAASVEGASAVEQMVCGYRPGGTVTVDGVPHPMPDVYECGFFGGGGGGGGGGGWGPGGGPGAFCSALARRKPVGCRSPESIQGGDYGSDHYVIGSGLAAAISNAYGGSLPPQVGAQIAGSLTTHTDDISRLVLPANTANQALIDGIAAACELQRQHDAANPPFSPHPGGVSPALKACLGTVSRLSGEAGSTFTSFFQNWLNNTGIVLADIGVPQTIINWLAPENSLKKKFDVINDQAQCNMWFDEVRANDC